MESLENQIMQDDVVNITDYTDKCPEGKRTFFAFAHFTNGSMNYWSNILADNRKDAITQILEKISDRIESVCDIALYERYEK